jgi:D-amino-acid dehydrogenase
MMDVCVLGSGIVGLATAYELSNRGLQVTVVDQSTPGSGTSGGNGAQLSYSYVQPLADASIWGQLPKLLLSPDSPLKIRPQLDINQWRWGLQFLRACNSGASAETTAQLLTLAALSRAQFDAMRAAHNPNCDFSSTGKLVLYPTTKAFDAAQRQVALQRQLGSQQSLVNAQACRELEPALEAYRAHIAGAVYTESECAVDCLKLCLELERILRARGVQFVLGHTIEKLEVNANRVLAVQTQAARLQAQHFVLALGSDSVRLARSVGVRLPVYPIKGYSVTLDINHLPSNAAPRINVTDIARKVVFARIGTRLRVAGMAELVGHDRSIAPQAIASLERSTHAVFPRLQGVAVREPWAGLRPATPGGMPIVGAHQHGPINLLMNTGHGALGLTLAFGTATLVAQLIQPS